MPRRRDLTAIMRESWAFSCRKYLTFFAPFLHERSRKEAHTKICRLQAKWGEIKG